MEELAGVPRSGASPEEKQQPWGLRAGSLDMDVPNYLFRHHQKHP